MDSEGNEITAEQQLGLLLYRGGTVCSRYSYVPFITYTTADAICKHMNFRRAYRYWTYNNRESFDYDVSSIYDITLYYVVCSSAEWENCSYDEKYKYCWNSNVFLSCTSK